MHEVFLKDTQTGLLVSNLGRVVGKTGKVLKAFLLNSYLAVSYYDPAKHHRIVKVHRLVARNFIPNPDNLPQINHKDENKLNNSADNLEWCTAQYNVTYGSHIRRQVETSINNGHTIHCSLEKNGIIKSAESMAELSRLIGEDQSSIRSVIIGRNSHTRGWHIPGTTPNMSTKAKEITLQRMDDVVIFPSIHKASEYIKSNIGHVSELVHGKRKTCKGWKLKSID